MNIAVRNILVFLFFVHVYAILLGKLGVKLLGLRVCIYWQFWQILAVFQSGCNNFYPHQWIRIPVVLYLH